MNTLPILDPFLHAFGQIMIPTLLGGLILISFAILLSSMSAGLECGQLGSGNLKHAVMRWTTALGLLATALFVADWINPWNWTHLPGPPLVRQTVLATTTYLYSAPIWLIAGSLLISILKRMRKGS